MAFFDDIGKAFTNAGQGAFQKTKEMADIAKFSSMLTEEEKKLNNVYFQIGKAYVQAHPEDYEEAFSVYFQSCNDIKKNIEDIRARIQQLKNVAECPDCGAEISADAVFCSVCGYHMPPKVVVIPEGMVKCATCGAAVKKEMRFCTTCGAPMADAQPVAPVKNCAVCGVPLSDDSAFCINCGAPVKADAEPVAPVAEPVIPSEEPVAENIAEPVTQIAAEPVSAPEEIPVAETDDFPIEDFIEMPIEEPVVAEVQDVAVCRQCNSPLEDGAIFCTECGTPVAPVEEKAEVFAGVCPNCGATLEDNAIFCTECGSKIR
ncbi:MAG: zinc ribbon domain-containing protein [Acutalibacteraceae bacterium]|nr:zinc ribbon domain-containing protein [Acutalibacteraceae bacterium]